MINWPQALVGGFIGLSIGIIYSEIRDVIRERQTKSKVRKSILKLFYFNLDRCVQMEKQLTIIKNGMIEIPNYLFDADTLKQVMFNGIGAFKTKEEQQEFEDINWRRYQLEHLNHKLTQINLSTDKVQLIQGFLIHLIQEKKEIEKVLGGWK